MTGYTIKHIADALGAKAQGDLSLEIITVNEPQSASSSELALAMDPRSVSFTHMTLPTKKNM